MKFRVLLLLALFLTALFAVPVQAQQALLLLEKGSVKVIGPKRTLLLRKPGTKMVLQPSDRVQTGKDTSVKIKIRGKPEIIELYSRSFFRMGKITRETSSVSLLTGLVLLTVKGKLKKKTKKARFQLRTVTAVIGVRGSVVKVGASRDHDDIFVKNGKAFVAKFSNTLSESLKDACGACEVEYSGGQGGRVVADSHSLPSRKDFSEKDMRQMMDSESTNEFGKLPMGMPVDANELRKENEEREEEEERQEEEEEQKKEEEKQKEEKSRDEGEPKKDEEGEDGEGKPRG